ncbi:MAG: ABC transporter permease, partial [Alphaproteobacteria bacterium]|nr:ABC transporter permease [Alphaproteobacteria bacterium]
MRGPTRLSDGRFVAFLRDFSRLPSAIAAVLVFAAIAIVAAAAPLISPQDPYDLSQLDIMDNLRPPGTRSFAGFTFVLGTDGQGRDILSAIFYGLRTSLVVGIVSGMLALAVGSFVGLVSAFAGGWVDALIMRIVDLQLGLPPILVALVLLVLLGSGAEKI